MNFSLIRQSVVAGVLLFHLNTAVAQVDELYGGEALRVYYSDLYMELAGYDLDDVPFTQSAITVKRDDSLLAIARQHAFPTLDSIHLAAALYETNAHAFDNGDASTLKVGATIKLPTITDIFMAQDRYEKLIVVGEEVDFTSEENQMSQSLRWPFGKSLVMNGPSARDELPSNQIVTLSSYRPAAAVAEQNANEDYPASAAGASNQHSGPRIEAVDQNKDGQTYAKWLNAIDVVDARSVRQSKADTTPVVPGNEWQREVLIVEEPAPGAAIKWADDAELLAESPIVPEPTALTVSELQAAITSDPESDPVEEASPHAQSAVVQELAMAAMVPTLEVAAAIEMPVIDLAIEDPGVPVAQSPAADESPVEIVPALKDSAVASQELPLPGKVEALMPGNSPPTIIAGAGAGAGAGVDVDADEVGVVEPAADVKTIVAGTEMNDDFYLGAPRNSAVAAKVVERTDPLSHIVEWSFNEQASVGLVLTKLADYVGYELVSTDDTVLDSYERRLPVIQRQVKEVPVEEGFAILAGRGLETVFDHVARSVKHIPKTHGQTKSIATITRHTDRKNSEVHEKFVQASGIAAMLKQFPVDMLSAAGRHADRCGSAAHTQLPDAERLYHAVIRGLGEQTPEPVARHLLEWYESPIGRKVLQLEGREIDDATLPAMQLKGHRVDRIQQIYNNTVTGKAISNIAIELDYAGWALSGCRQMAERSGDVQKMHMEMIHGQNIKKKADKLESLLRDDMLRSMALQFSLLSERELTDYAEMTEQNAGVYAELQRAILNAIAFETMEVSASASSTH